MQSANIVAFVAIGVAALALALLIFFVLRLRRVYQDQRLILGPKREDDLVSHVARIERGFTAVTERVEEAAAKLDERMGATEAKVASAFTHRAIVRYDAYGEMSGQQSISIAMLDRDQNGLVFSSIAHRDGTRLYCNEIVKGVGERDLSPEESEAVKLALSGNGDCPQPELALQAAQD